MVISEEEKQSFKDACEKICGKERERSTIGTLSEKTMHAVLKNYIMPKEEYHEVLCGKYVADILYEGEVIEIQTAGFDRLRNKLNEFLKTYDVTIVYPIPREKWINWINEESGELKERRKSPKKGSRYDCFHELYKIKMYLNHPNLHLRLMMIDTEEYRIANGWSKDGKRGSTRFDRIPLQIAEDLYINTVEEYALFIPEELTKDFTSKDYKRCTKLTQKNAQTGLHILNYLNVVERIGKSGNSFIYQRTVSNKST